jgi:hypothetical protein
MMRKTNKLVLLCMIMLIAFDCFADWPRSQPEKTISLIDKCRFKAYSSYAMRFKKSEAAEQKQILQKVTQWYAYFDELSEINFKSLMLSVDSSSNYLKLKLIHAKMKEHVRDDKESGILQDLDSIKITNNRCSRYIGELGFQVQTDFVLARQMLRDVYVSVSLASNNAKVMGSITKIKIYQQELNKFNRLLVTGN